MTHEDAYEKQEFYVYKCRNDDNYGDGGTDLTCFEVPLAKPFPLAEWGHGYILPDWAFRYLVFLGHHVDVLAQGSLTATSIHNLWAFCLPNFRDGGSPFIYVLGVSVMPPLNEDEPDDDETKRAITGFYVVSPVALPWLKGHECVVPGCGRVALAPSERAQGRCPQ